MSLNHNHNIVNYNRPIIIGIILNVVFIIIEVFYGLISNSIALISDAGHNFSDVISLLLAYVATIFIKKKSSEKFTYGYKKGSIIIALINSILLFVALGVIIWEAVQRFNNPVQIDGNTVIIVASIGILINGFTAYLFLKGKKKDLNIKSAFLHMLTDALVSAGVVISGIFILLYQLFWLDPIVSLIIVGIIFSMTWKLLMETIKMSIDAVPGNINVFDVYNYLKDIKGVKDIHDLHIWNLSTSHIAMTVHIVLENNYFFTNDIFKKVNQDLKDKFDIIHSTIQTEYDTTADSCLKC